MKPAKVKDYLAHGGTRCPFCHTRDIQDGDLDRSYTKAETYQHMSCNQCQRGWVEIYTLFTYAIKPEEDNEAYNLYEKTGDERLRTVM
jgi:hypothetical protein